jgi:hypothetical protein
MGGDKESKSSVTIDPAVVARINEITDEAMDLFKLDSDFYKNFMMPFQKDMMKLNRKLLPQMGKIAKTQLRIQQADLLQDKELRDQLRASAKADIEKADVLGEELFGRIMEAADVESATGKKRSEIAQETGTGRVQAEYSSTDGCRARSIAALVWWCCSVWYGWYTEG